jgi:hypothetical protein
VSPLLRDKLDLISCGKRKINIAKLSDFLGIKAFTWSKTTKYANTTAAFGHRQNKG